MAKYEAFPVISDRYPSIKSPALWQVVKRSEDGIVSASPDVLAAFHGAMAEKDAKCHAAKLNERESGPASPFADPEFEVKERLVEEGEKFIAGMAEPVKFQGVPAMDPELEAAMNTDPRSGERYPRSR